MQVKAPPIKCQGIKTKLVPFIFENITWKKSDQKIGKWIEPFLGSGVVAFNIAPQRALLCDTNKHLIRLYKDIQSKKITKSKVHAFLEKESKILKTKGESHYYHVRERFNENPNSLDFIFLNRSCFNGLMRFNRSGFFNVPFCRKPERFSKAYITKISNQVDWLSNQMIGKAWVFEVSHWKKTLSKAEREDFVYLDPPYIGRHTDYFNAWTDCDAVSLASDVKKLPCRFALSMWLENKYRKNQHIEDNWNDFNLKVFEHFYHLGSNEGLRNSMKEALIINN